MHSKKEKRSLFQMIFGNTSSPVKDQQLSTFQFLSNLNNKVYSGNFRGSIYNDITVRAIIDTVSKHTAKAKMIHALKGKEQDSQLNRLLKRPNPLQNSFDFIGKIVTNYYLFNNVYVYIQRLPTGQPSALWVVEYNSAEIKEDQSGNLYLSFTFGNGKYTTESLDNIIVLRRNLKGDFYAENNDAIIPTLGVMQTLREGIIKAIANSAVIRGILELIGMQQPEDLKAKTKQFSHDMLNVENSNGVVATDNTMKYTPLEQSGTTVIDEKVTAEVRKQLFEYFGVPEGIVSGDYTEAQFRSFWENCIKPLLILFGQEFTQKIFNANQLAFGNEIKFKSDKIEYLSYQTRIDLISSVRDLGVLRKGTICELLELPEPPDPDTVVTYVNYTSNAMADADAANTDNEDDTNNDQ